MDVSQQEFEIWKARALKAERENAELKSQSRSDAHRLHIQSPIIGWVRVRLPEFQKDLEKLKIGLSAKDAEHLDDAEAEGLISSLQQRIKALTDTIEKRYREDG